MNYIIFSESKAIPQQGLQLFVELPDAVRRKTKKLDVEMMMKRKINRVKKEYQVYMHKVHILCWLGHGNYVSKVLNDQELLAASLSLVPGKECYPGERVDLKYVEQITTWFKDKLTLKQDKNENKFRPKAPPLKDILLEQIKKKVVTSKKYSVFIFVAMLRAIGLQCRIMFNFVTLPIKPPSSELCSLSTKPKDGKDPQEKSKPVANDGKNKAAASTSKKTNVKPKNPKVAQVDGCYDDEQEDFENIMQVDGSNDVVSTQTRNTRTRKVKNAAPENEDVSPPKRSRKSPGPKPTKTDSKNEPSSEVKSETGKVVSKSDTKKKQTHNTANTKIKKNAKEKPKSDCNIEDDLSVKTGLKTSEEKDSVKQAPSPRKTRRATSKDISNTDTSCKDNLPKKTSNKKPSKLEAPKIVVSNVNEKEDSHSSKYFSSENNSEDSKMRLSRKRSKTTNPSQNQSSLETEIKKPSKTRTKSAPGSAVEKSKYFDNNAESPIQNKKLRLSLKSNKSTNNKSEDLQRVSHRDLAKNRTKPKNDVTGDLVNIIKGRVKEAKEMSKIGIVKGKNNLN